MSTFIATRIAIEGVQEKWDKRMPKMFMGWCNGHLMEWRNKQRVCCVCCFRATSAHTTLLA
jgi:hypothetical protein